MLKKHPFLWSVGWAAIALIVFVKATTLAPSYKDCDADQQASYSEDEQNNFFDQASSFIYCEGVYAQANNGAITAIATAFLTIITALLAWLAYEQSKTGRAQLRAYISANAIKAGILKDDKTIYVIVELRNTGQTPAFEFSDLGNLLVLPYPIAYHLNLTPEAETSQRPNPTYVFYPGAVHASVPSLTMTWEDAIKMKRDGYALYVFGRMDYKDVFGRPQWGEFCAAIEPKDFWAWIPIALEDRDRQAVKATFRFTKGNNRASS
jgi:hypothetical protein